MVEIFLGFLIPVLLTESREDLKSVLVVRCLVMVAVLWHGDQ